MTKLHPTPPLPPRQKPRSKPKPKPKPKPPAPPAAPHKPPAPPAPHTPLAPPEPKPTLRLRVEDLKVHGGGAWRLQHEPAWKKSSVETFQGKPALRVFYGKGSGTSAHHGVGGMTFVAVPHGLPGTQALMAFEVYFEPGWDFSKGGKIGGFHIGNGVASGYRHSDTGSSHRIMWQRGGGAISYIYPPSNLAQVDPKLDPEGHGIGYFADLFPAGTLKVGQWNSIEIGVKINSFTNGKPNPDGVAVLTINGKTGVKRDIRWSRSPNLVISSFIFGTFFGGPDPAVVDCAAYYRNFAMLPWKMPRIPTPSNQCLCTTRGLGGILHATTAPNNARPLD